MASSKLKTWQRIFCNRSINMAHIRAIGFDMDHTLALYNQEAFETLAFEQTLKKFIAAGYPKELGDLSFDPTAVIRGLLVDTKRGNLLKVDGHKYVKYARHGHRELTKEERHTLYNAQSFKAQNFASVDTFFALSEVFLYTEIVEYMRLNPGKIDKSIHQVYSDLRHFIDLSHADGSIKDSVMANPERFFNKDRQVGSALKRLLDGGKRLFLLTNSHWAYTNCVMNHILEDSDFTDWKDFFEIVIVGAGKPAFFTGNQPFYEVITEEDLLRQHRGPLEQGHVYHAGNAKTFQELTKLKGDEILYVGDHMYGDIIRSKELFNWRTLLVVEELDQQLPKMETYRAQVDEIIVEMERKEEVDEDLQKLRTRIDYLTKQLRLTEEKGEQKKSLYLERDLEKLGEKLTELEQQLSVIESTIRGLIESHEKNIHPVWGELMRTGIDKSRFARQVEEYACLYSTRVSNLRFYSPFKKFRSPHDLMPHDVI